VVWKVPLCEKSVALIVDLVWEALTQLSVWC
jgi:hypothetical protein